MVFGISSICVHVFLNETSLDLIWKGTKVLNQRWEWGKGPLAYCCHPWFPDAKTHVRKFLVKLFRMFFNPSHVPSHMAKKVTLKLLDKNEKFQEKTLLKCEKRSWWHGKISGSRLSSDRELSMVYIAQSINVNKIKFNVHHIKYKGNIWNGGLDCTK